MCGMCGGGPGGDNGTTLQRGAMRDPPAGSELAHRAPLGCAPAMLHMPCDVHHGLGHTCGATWLPPGQGGSRPACVRQHQGRHGGTCDGYVWRWRGHPMGMALAHVAPCDMLRRDEDARALACMRARAPCGRIMQRSGCRHACEHRLAHAPSDMGAMHSTSGLGSGEKCRIALSYSISKHN